jgi:hypothetical protein
MRARDFILEALLITDVPNEEWLQGKIDWAKKKGHDSYNSPYFGTTTAYIRQPSYVELSVDLLKRIPGARQEQQNVRQKDLEAIINIMKDTGKLPIWREEEYRPFIGVAWNGDVRVLEGNHRIMAAAALGWKTLPVELKYFDGGERVKSGMLYPPKIGLKEPAPGTSITVNDDYDPNETPPGPETKPTMPRGTVKVDVSDVYDWYKLGQHISHLKGLGKHDFGKGPPSTIFSFGDEETEHEYIKDLERTGLTTTDIDPLDPKQPKGMKRQKTDPTYNVENFADGKNPGRKGLAKRSGVDTKASVSTLRNVAKNSTGEKQRMAHWLANMKAGRAKTKK